MNRFRLISLFAVCALLVVPFAAMAQDGEEEMQEYTSPDGLLTVSYPADWFAQESNFLYGVSLANQEDVFEMMESEESPEAMPTGTAVIDVILATFDQFGTFGMEMEEGMTPEEMFGVFLEFISAPEGGPPAAEGTAEPGMEATEEAAMAATEEPAAMDATAEPGMEGSEVGEIQTVTFEDGREAVWATVSSPFSDDAYIFFEVADNVFAVVDVFAAPGELTQELIDTAVQVSQSVVFTGTTEDLEAVAMPEIEQSDVDPATLDGNALVDERCTTCHDRERIDTQDKDEEGWTATVDRMIGYGADLDSAERQAVINYLVETH